MENVSVTGVLIVAAIIAFALPVVAWSKERIRNAALEAHAHADRTLLSTRLETIRRQRLLLQGIIELHGAGWTRRLEELQDQVRGELYADNEESKR